LYCKCWRSHGHYIMSEWLCGRLKSSTESCLVLSGFCFIKWFSSAVFVIVRFALHKIEQELGTEIKPIPKVIDKELYVAEFQLQQQHQQQADEAKDGDNSSSQTVPAVQQRDWMALLADRLAPTRLDCPSVCLSVYLRLMSCLACLVHCKYICRGWKIGSKKNLRFLKAPKHFKSPSFGVFRFFIRCTVCNAIYI